MGSLSQFEENVDPLLRGHLSAGKGVGGIGCFEGVENADYFLHSFSLPRFPHFTPPGLYPRACRKRSSHAWAADRMAVDGGSGGHRRVAQAFGYWEPAV